MLFTASRESSLDEVARFLPGALHRVDDEEAHVAVPVAVPGLGDQLLVGLSHVKDAVV